MESRRSPSGDASSAVVAVEGATGAPGRTVGPAYFTGSYEHAVDEKHRLVLPAPFRSRLAAGAYLGPVVWCLGLWPEDAFGAVLDTWQDGVDLGMVSEEVRDAFVASTFYLQPDAQGRVVVHKSLRNFAEITGPVVIVGARQRLGIWSADRWGSRQQTIPGGPDAAIRQATKDLKL